MWRLIETIKCFHCVKILFFLLQNRILTQIFSYFFSPTVHKRTMKTSALILFVLIVSAGCKKEEPAKGCYKENPLTELAWLAKLTDTSQRCPPTIYESKYKNQAVFLVDFNYTGKGSQCDAFGVNVHDCQGEKIDVLGGDELYGLLQSTDTKIIFKPN